MIDETKEEAPLTHGLEMYETWENADGSISILQPEMLSEEHWLPDRWPPIDQMLLLGLIIAHPPTDEKDTQSDDSRLKAAMKLVLRRAKNPPNWNDDFDMHALRWMAEEQFKEEKAVYEHRLAGETGEEPTCRSERELAELAYERFKCSIPKTLQQKYSLSYGGESRYDNPGHKRMLANQALENKQELKDKQKFLDDLKELLQQHGVAFENPLDNSRIRK